LRGGWAISDLMGAVSYTTSQKETFNLPLKLTII